MNSNKATFLIRDMGNRSARVATVANELAYTRPPSGDTWQFQTNEVGSIRADINEMGKDLCTLQAMRSALPDWEQTAIDRAFPRLAGMARNATDAIGFINSEQHALWRPELRQYESALEAQARALSRMMEEYADYAHVHKRDQQLANSLEIETAM